MRLCASLKPNLKLRLEWKLWVAKCPCDAHLSCGSILPILFQVLRKIAPLPDAGEPCGLWSPGSPLAVPYLTFDNLTLHIVLCT